MTIDKNIEPVAPVEKPQAEVEEVGVEEKPTKTTTKQKKTTTAKDKTEPAKDKKEEQKEAKPKKSEVTTKKEAMDKPKKPAPKKGSAKKVKKDSAKDEDEKDKKVYKPKQKPKLDDQTSAMLKLRADRKAKKPKFRRQEWFRYKRVGEEWRKPRGIHSKTRRHFKYRQNVASIGFSSPKEARGLHPSGFMEVMVFNTKDLESINPDLQAARIGHSVGIRSRIDIEERAQVLGIRVLNRRM